MQHGAGANARRGGCQAPAPRTRAPCPREAAPREPDRGAALHARHPEAALRTWDRDLTSLRTADGRDLPPNLRAELDRLRRRLVLTLELIREIEAERGGAAAPEEGCQKTAAPPRIRGGRGNVAPVLTRGVFSP